MIHNNRHPQQAWLWLLIAWLCCTACCLSFSPLLTGVGYDREVFRYEGMLLSEGGIPYRDVFDHKPPLIYFTAFIGHLTGLGNWGYWLTMVLFASTAALLTFAAARRHLGLLTALLLSTAWSLLISMEYLASDMGNTRLCASSLVVSCMAVSFLLKGRASFFLQGLLAALVFWFQQNEVLALFPFLLYSLFRGMGRGIDFSLRSTLQRLLAMLAGALAPTLLLLIYFGLNGALDDFLFQAFVFNFKYYRSPLPFTGKLERTLGTFFSHPFSRWMAIPFGAGLLLVLTAVLNPSLKPLRSAALTLLACALLQIVATAFSGFSGYHYFLSFSPWVLCLLVFAAVVRRAQGAGPYPIAASAFLVLSVLILAGNKAYKVRGMVLAHADNSRSEGYCINPAVLQELQEVRGKAGQLYAFRSAQSLAYNTALNIKAPTKWIYTHFYGDLSNWDPQGACIDTIMRDLDRSKCLFLMDYSGDIPLPVAAWQHKWDAYVVQTYVPVHPIRILRYKGVLYKRKQPLR